MKKEMRVISKSQAMAEYSQKSWQPSIAHKNSLNFAQIQAHKFVEKQKTGSGAEKEEEA